MRIGSLFSGAGGLDLAVMRAFGGRVVWHAEIEWLTDSKTGKVRPNAAVKVLAHHWPDVPNLGDISAVDWSTVEPVDILCGGFPCQDVSTAGLRAGIAEGTRSGLWAMFAKAIAALRPKLVVIENVRGLLSADGEEWPAEVVAADLEAARLARVVALINSKIRRAIQEGWWHGEYKRRKQFESTRLARLRDRALARFRTLKRRLVQRAIGTVIGDLASLGYDAQWTTVSAASIGAPHQRDRVFILAADAESECGANVTGRGNASGQHVVTVARAGDRDRSGCAAARGELVGRTATELAAVDHLLPTPAASRSGNNQSASAGAAVRPSLDSITDLLPTPRRSDGDGGANPLSRAERMDDVETRVIRIGDTWGKYEPAIRRWESLTRPAPSPTEPNTKGNPRLAPAFPEWMQGFDAGWITAVPGISRNDQLRIIGNSVCPQQAEAALWQLIQVCEVAA